MRIKFAVILLSYICRASCFQARIRFVRLSSNLVVINPSVTKSLSTCFSLAANALHDESNEGVEAKQSTNKSSNDHRFIRQSKAIGKRFASFLAVGIVGVIFRFMLQVMNRVKTRNLGDLMKYVDGRPDGTPLLTVSNHMSVLDDPGLWCAILPFWRLGPKKMRWSLCTDDVYFAVKPLVPIYRLGNAMPIKRRLPMEQPMFKDFFQKLDNGGWCHIFAEGRVWQPWRFPKGEPVLGDFKTGVGRLITRCSKTPIIIPMYHIGMHTIAPEQQVQGRATAKLRKVFGAGHKVFVYFGSPVDVSPILKKWSQGLNGQPGIGEVSKVPWEVHGSEAEVSCHKEITEVIRNAILELESVARKEYYGNI